MSEDQFVDATVPGGAALDNGSVDASFKDKNKKKKK